ncbi:MAG: Rne/Rng family ribonuclease [Ignavibacteriae bacterium]|nr:Rne/Rng family ribonuclease [Ignavibacteriota bacterium]
MKKEIIINETANEIRIAITEDKRLAELYVESPEKERLVGDIFFGKIARVMPGIRAAFIDIGHKQDAFLHFSDIGESFNEYSALVGEDDADIDDDDDDDDAEEDDEIPGSTSIVEVPATPISKGRYESKPRQRYSRPPENKRTNPNLTAGQDIIVQVTKEPVGRKGVRVTSEISLPGRFLVLMPFNGRIGVSKKIPNFREKRRLRRIVRSLLPNGFGVIIRTVATDREESAIKQDLEKLIETWREVEKKVKAEQPPTLLYKDMSTTSHVIRDLFTDNVERVVTDSKRLHKEIRTYLDQNSAHLIDKVELYKDREPIFDAYGVEKEIATSFGRKVWLKSGGYIIIEQTEAMVVVDVNSGRYAAKREQEQNSLRTNLEASRELCRQLRLRDIGGIIVVDFIDLEDDSSRKKVYDEVRKEFRRDRAKVTVLPMTEFGIVQITRQRIRQSVLHSFSEPCPVCGGAGLVQSKATVVNHIERWLSRFKSEGPELRLTLKLHPSLAAYLNEGFWNKRREFMLRFRVIIKLEEDPKMPVAEYRFFSVKQNKDITETFESN